MVKEILLSALGLSVGVALVSGWYHLRGPRPPVEKSFYVMARWGFAIAFGLLLEALAKAPIIESSWRTWLFTLACVCVAVGFAGVAYEDRKEVKNGS